MFSVTVENELQILNLRQIISPEVAKVENDLLLDYSWGLDQDIALSKRINSTGAFFHMSLTGYSARLNPAYPLTPNLLKYVEHDDITRIKYHVVSIAYYQRRFVQTLYEGYVVSNDLPDHCFTSVFVTPPSYNTSNQVYIRSTNRYTPTVYIANKSFVTQKLKL